MSRHKDLKKRARAAGLEWDGKANAWRGRLNTFGDDGQIAVMAFTLPVSGLAAYLDPPALPDGLSPLPDRPAPSGGLSTAPSDSPSSSRPEGAGHREVAA